MSRSSLGNVTVPAVGFAVPGEATFQDHHSLQPRALLLLAGHPIINDDGAEGHGAVCRSGRSAVTFSARIKYRRIVKVPLPYPPLASSPPKKPVVFAPDDNSGRLPPPPPHRRSVRDLQIPIGCAQPNRASPSRGFLLTRLSDAGPAPSPARPQRAGVRNPSAFPSFTASLVTASSSHG